MTMSAGAREIELLDRLIRADEAKPGELFVVAFLNNGTVVRHAGLSADESIVGEAALLGLDAARLLLINTHDDRGRPKSFYLPSDAARSLEELRESADRAARQAAERQKAQAASAGGEPLSLAEMLAAMIEAQKAAPGQFFTRYAMNSYPSLGHPAWPELKPIEHMELARLLHSGAVVQPDPTSGALLHLLPVAADVLAAELRLQGDSPLAIAEARGADLAELRRAYARRAGTRAHRLVMGILIAIIVALAAASITLQSIAPAILAVLVIGYEVVTDGFGWDAASIAHRAGKSREQAVLRELGGDAP